AGRPQRPAGGDWPEAPDEAWDALLAGLPADVQAFVDRTKVPRVHFTRDRRTGRGRLWIKFDTPMSKYAFALGQSEEEVFGTTSVVDIMRKAVHQTFGDDVALAPTEQMADGQSAPPFGKLPEEQQRNIKAQLTREKLSRTPGVTMGFPAASRESSGSDSHDASSSPSTDDGVHRGRAEGAAAPAPIDPWDMPEPVPGRIDFDKVDSFDQQAAQRQSSRAQEAPRQIGHAVQRQRPNRPDPWGEGSPMAMAPEGLPQAAPGGQGLGPGPNGPGAPDGPQAGWAPGKPDMGPGPEPDEPPVDPDEDEYSMDDASLGASTAMSLKEVEELFQVKKVEEFAADDPHNPRNQK
ncbi:MAG: hypothetical protein UHD09_01275, partial [Bifidobacterium sp.]|nr:hypothetical protein [Bifidobacterium sp.]